MRHHHAEHYVCEICGTRYDTAALALRCEEGGRPVQRFSRGDVVFLCGGGYSEQFPGRPFRVNTCGVFLERPGMEMAEEPEVGRHLNSYVIVDVAAGSRIAFVPEYHLTPGES